jgi:steroid delta-isomerase-like uncharacterized protein
MKFRWAVILSTVLIACTTASAKDITPQVRKSIEQSFAAWNAHDLDKLASFYTSDVTYEDVTFGITAHGSEELKKMVQGFYDGVPDLKLELVDCKADENGGWVEWTFSGTDKGLYKTGKKFSVRGASVFQLRGGKFSTNKDYYDAATIMKQVGALPQQ